MKSKIVTEDMLLVPIKGTENALCYDLRAKETVTIKSGEIGFIPLGVKSNFANKIYVRSSLPYKKGLILANGVGIIDKDYRGEIIGQVYNITKKDVTIEQYERCIQMEALTEKNIIEDILVSEIEYNDWESLTPTNRGSGGFGSTGIL